jgi:DNA topoisomerase VI subunit A
MTESDINIGENLFKDIFIKQNAKWVEALEWMVEQKKKIQIEALTVIEFHYLSNRSKPKERTCIIERWIHTSL